LKMMSERQNNMKVFMLHIASYKNVRARRMAVRFDTGHDSTSIALMMNSTSTLRMRLNARAPSHR
jgi:hypothetical protein